VTTSERWAEALGYVKLVVVWVANYFTLTNLNAMLSTVVLLATLAYTALQIDKLLREREAAIRAGRLEADRLAQLEKERE
jgi:hypothetical protein